jgi:salicylate hydroxylase
MLPYLAQGANSAIEDGTVLGLLLGHIQSRIQVPQALNMYQKLRKARGESIVRETFKQVRITSNDVLSLPTTRDLS